MTKYRTGSDHFGRHRVISPDGALPQAATRLDNSLPIYEDEILIDVSTLNIDSASFRQMREAAGNDLGGVAREPLPQLAVRHVVGDVLAAVLLVQRILTDDEEREDLLVL